MPKTTIHLISVFAGLLLAGLLLSNVIVIAMSLTPLVLVLVGLSMSPPRSVAAAADEMKSPVWLGEDIEIVRRFTISRGIGTVTLFQEIPAELSLVAGSNLWTHWQWGGPSAITVSFRVRAAKRGRYSLPPLQWLARHPLGLSEESGSAGDEAELVVWPRVVGPKLIKSFARLATSPLPSAEVARMGIRGTDFREIRRYVPGDSVKSINWRATARRAEPVPWPLVNEYEREGRKSVLLFVNATRSTELGSSIENGLECCLEAAGTLFYYYLDRNYRTGIYLCSQPHRFLYPDTGRQQFLKAFRYFVDLRPGRWSGELLTALEKSKRYVLGYNPLAVIVTTLDPKSAGTLETMVKRLRRMYSRRHRPSMMVVGISSADLVPVEADYRGNLTVLSHLQTRPLVRRLKSYGANVIEWNPTQESFASVFHRKVWVK